MYRCHHRAQQQQQQCQLQQCLQQSQQQQQQQCQQQQLPLQLPLRFQLLLSHHLSWQHKQTLAQLQQAKSPQFLLQPRHPFPRLLAQLLSLYQQQQRSSQSSLAGASCAAS
jgi:hypothetical protein